MKTLIALLLLLPALAAADPQPWMKKDNPSELTPLLSIGSGCSLTQENISGIVEGVMVRSRIKPMDEVGTLNLLVTIDCVKFDNLNPDVISVSVDFVGLANAGEDQVLIRWGAFGGAMLGLGDNADAERLIREGVEDAIASYLQVNSDLGADE